VRLPSSCLLLNWLFQFSVEPEILRHVLQGLTGRGDASRALALEDEARKLAQALENGVR
jgi:hypothetical protein